MDVSNLILAGIAAAAALAGLWYQRRTRQQRQLEEIADLLAELQNAAGGYTSDLSQATAKARLKTRLGRRTDLPKTRALLDVAIRADIQHMELVAAAQGEVEAKLHG